MKESLRFDPDAGRSCQLELEGRTIRFREWTDLPYCAHPEDPIQKLNLYVPEALMQGQRVNGHGLHDAPIFCPNTVGGYMPGPADGPGVDRFGRVNSIFEALDHGYVVMSAGVRGRTTGRASDEFFEGSVLKETGTNAAACGKAPAFVVDMKAAIRWLRHNKDLIPGDTEKIIVSGTSAGGALAALTGASGNQPDYAPYLEAIGALDQRDDVFAASCYCPITDLAHADMAYEWQYGKETAWNRMIKRRTATGLVREKKTGTLSPREQELARALAALFPAYLNGLDLKDETGQPLVLDENGNGPFRDWIAGQVLDWARREEKTREFRTLCPDQLVAGLEPEDKPWLKDGLDWDGYIAAITRMKGVPAFDALDGTSPENEEFGTRTIERQHFTEFSARHALDGAGLADARIIRMMNPMSYIGAPGTARHWRIRHGACDRDTSLAIPAILALSLEKAGIHPDFGYPWGLPHAGDYDLPELFAWIDGLAKGDNA